LLGKAWIYVPERMQARRKANVVDVKVAMPDFHFDGCRGK